MTWDFPLVGRTRMLTEEWLAAGHPTTFVQIPSYRTAAQRISEPFRSSTNVPVVRPWPTYPAASWTRISEARLRKSATRSAQALLRKLVRHVDVSSAVALVVSPVWTPWLDALPFRSIVYDCIDDVEVMTPRPELRSLYQRWEGELIDRADAAVASAENLAASIHKRRPDLPVTTIRNGVRVEDFSSRVLGADRPADLPRSQGRPVVGFVGALYDWIDWDLIHAVAQQLPDFDFVFVGPHEGRSGRAAVSHLQNVFLLGHRPYDQIPGYVAGFDVCWVPFRSGEVSARANPVKIYEYLALGKPVVSTPVADTESFEGLIDVESSPVALGDLLRRAVTNAHLRAAERVAFAGRNTWRARADQYLDFIAALPHRTPMPPIRELNCRLS